MLFADTLIYRAHSDVTYSILMYSYGISTAYIGVDEGIT